MKKTLWIAIAGALAASVIAASAQEVLSANAVGYIKKTLPASGKLIALSAPLDSMTESSIVFGRTSIAQEAPTGSTVFFWDPVLQGWSGGVKGTKGWQPAQSNKVIASGEAFFLKGSASDVIDREITITGEVPADTSLPRSVPGSALLGTVGNPFPVDFKFGTSSLASNATQGSTVFFWDTVAQGWSGGVKGSKGWQPAQSNRVVLAAEGFFLKEVGSGYVWTNSKPYTWP